MADRRIQFPQPVVNGHGYGRNINHDPRSLRYKVGREAAAHDAEWDIFIPILDQGQIGKCVAETGAEYLGSSVFWNTLPDDVKKAISTSVSTAEDWTSALYHELTLSDDYPGTWKPDDTGSDGLTLGKVLTSRKLINGFQHATTVGEAEAAIQSGPFAIGTVFLSDMENPRPDGTVKVSGTVLGGHEYLCFKRDAGRDLWWFRNHWTASWGLKGTFAYDTPGLQTLMAQQGDITVFVPNTEPAPTPTPDPTPAPVPTPTDNQPNWDILQPFIDHPRAWTKAYPAAAELTRWRGTLS